MIKNKIGLLIEKIFQKLQTSVLTARLKSKTTLKEKILPKQKMIFMILLLGAVAFVWEHSHDSNPPPSSENAKSVDTFIPAGFVLVPIQLSNAEALDSIIGSKGVVDLFIPDPRKPGRSKKVAEHIKILRAPLNPNQFAVLVDERSSAQLVHYDGAYFAIVQNPKTIGTQLETPPKRKISSRLIMEDAHETRQISNF